MINSIVWFLGPPNRCNEAVLLMHFDGSCYLICGGSNSNKGLWSWAASTSELGCRYSLYYYPCDFM